MLPSLRTYSTQLVIGLLLLVLITSLGTSVPAYWFTHARLDRQIALHLTDTAHSTRALLDNEAQRLAGLALLFAERPTLNQLIGAEARAELAAYSADFQTQIGIDLLLICDAGGRAIVSLPAATTCPAAAGVARLQGRPALVARQPLAGAENDWIAVLGIWLDDAMMAELAAGTGVEQSLLGPNGERLAASLAAASPLPPDLTGGMDLVTVAGHAYYRRVAPLDQTGTDGPLYTEILLAADDLVATRSHALWSIFGTTGLVAMGAALVGAWFIRRLTAPLERLTARADRISQGDLSLSITALAGPHEVQTLSAALQRGQTRIVHALRELAAARDRLDNLLQSLVEGVVVIDEGSVIRYWNQGAELITGWPAAAALGKTLDQVLPRSEPPQGSLLDMLPLPGHRARATVLTSGGRSTVLEVTSVRAADAVQPGGRPAERALVLRDVTEEEAMNHLRTYFLANISHEFRTPLSTLTASIELLMDEENTISAAEMRTLLNPIHLSLLELQTLIENLLAGSSIEAGLFRLRPKPIQLNEAIHTALVLVQPMLARRGQTLSLTEPVRMAAIQGDRTRLTQVLVNLLVNASKYAPAASPIDLTVEPESGGGYRVAVADHGPGIPPGERVNLFRRFVRLDLPGESSAARQASEMHGTGIGLYVVKTIVEAHGGRVGIDENPGGGSVFWFSLPPAPAPA